MILLIKPGDVLKLNELDYLYGAGTLIVRVTKVGGVQDLRDGQWLDLEGIELRQEAASTASNPGTSMHG